MVLVDTNIAVALWVESVRTDAARELFELDPDWRSEAFLLVEFSNVMTTFVRRGLASDDEALVLLGQLGAFFAGRLYEAQHGDCLRAALAHGVSAYDARFLVVADQLRSPLVTEDVKLRRAASGLTCSLDEARRT